MKTVSMLPGHGYEMKNHLLFYKIAVNLEINIELRFKE